MVSPVSFTGTQEFAPPYDWDAEVSDISLAGTRGFARPHNWDAGVYVISFRLLDYVVRQGRRPLGDH